MFNALEILKQKGVKISTEEEKGAMLAVLLHDVGHGPFSHALENILMDNWHHEKLSLLLMEQLNEEFSGELTIAIQMFQGKYHRKFFNQLISSQLDVDRLDYLKRDSFYTGVSEGNINTQRILSTLNVLDDELVLDEKGIYSIEHYLVARMFMYWQVYYHKAAVLAENLLIKIMNRAKTLVSQNVKVEASENLKYFLYRESSTEATEEDIARFMELDDTDVLQAIKSWKNHEDFVLSYLCKTVINRKFPKIIYSSTPFSDDLVQEKVQETNLHFGIENGELLVDNIERNLLPYDKTKQPIYLLRNDMEKVALEQAGSQILSMNINEKTTRYILSFPKEIS
jgi:HD domain protein